MTRQQSQDDSRPVDLQSRLVTTVIADAWDGESVLSKDLDGHNKSLVHHLSITTKAASLAASNITVRARPIGASRFVEISPKAEALAITAKGIRFQFQGFYDSFSLTASAAFGDVVQVTLTSHSGDAGPRIATDLASRSDGAAVSKILLGHEALTSHSISLMPSVASGAGSYEIYGLPIDTDNYVLLETLDISDHGKTASVSGGFRGFYVNPLTEIASGDLDVRVVSFSQSAGSNILAFDVTGATDNDLLYRSGGVWVDTAGLLTWDGSLLTAESFSTKNVKITDSGGTDYGTFTHDGTNFLFTFFQTQHIDFSGHTGALRFESNVTVRAGKSLFINSSDNTQNFQLFHDGTDANIKGKTGTADLNITGLTGSVKIDGNKVVTDLQDLRALKQSDETKNSDTTLAIDGDLQVELEANVVYGFKCFVVFNAAATPDFKCDFTTPTSSGGGFSTPTSLSFFAFTSSLIGTGTGTNRVINITGSVATAGTAGTFGLRWAQNTSDAGDTILRQGSWLRVFKE